MSEVQEQVNVVATQNQEQSSNSESSPVIKSEENQANWKAFRENREQERKARQEAEKIAKQKAEETEALKAALEAITNKPAMSYREETDESEESRIDRRVREIIAEREIKYERDAQERELKEYPQRLNSTFRDFGKICSTENLDYLDYHYPEVTKAFAYMPEGFDKWASIYQAVRKFVPNPDSQRDSLRADKNLSKPGSLSSSSNAHGANAMPSAKLDEARKNANWERMQRVLKTTSG
jgi:hypothetical protein